MVEEQNKIYYSFDKKEREGFRTFDPSHPTVATPIFPVDEIAGEGVLEKVKDLIWFIEMCHKALKPEGIATFTAPYFTSFQAWQDPRNIRGISQASLNFADKTWREQNGCPDLADCDFEVACNFALDLTAVQRSEDAKNFWINRYCNIVQSVMFTLKKR